MSTALCWGQIDSPIFRDGERYVLTLNKEVLENEVVKKHLTSGLTTTFRLDCRFRNANSTVNNQIFAIAIRYELWDEVFLVSFFDSNNKVQSESLKGWQELERWWTESRFNFESESLTAGMTFRVNVEVIPFSARERAAAAAWVNQSIGERDSSNRPGSHDIGARILTTIVATSFKRRVLQAFLHKGVLP